VLERVRDLLATLRQRSGVVMYSDAMDAHHEAMEAVLTKGSQRMSEPQRGMHLMAQVGVLDHLAERLRTLAPADWQADAAFNSGRLAVSDSVAALRGAVLAQDVAAVAKAIAGLKGPYSRLFLKFG
jgi:hypothetical protein